MKARAVEARPGRRPSSEHQRAELADRLRQRREEIEDAVMAKVRSVEDPGDVGDAEYVQGLRSAVRIAFEHAICVLGGDQSGDAIPPELVAQARLAARSGVGLDIVLRRYLAGHILLCDFLLQEAEGGCALQRALRAQAVLLDRIVSEVTYAYGREIAERSGSTERRRAEQVKRLLAGEPGDAPELAYDLELWHLGITASGADAASLLRELAAALGRRLLMVRPGGREVWAWLGGQRRIEAEEVLQRASAQARSDLALAIGEPASGVPGWRLTHRQAKAALPIALRDEAAVVRYSDVAILASVLGDEVLTESLSKLYLSPLAAERDGGAVLRETLRAYFAAGHNTASTAVALGVSRQTVFRRLHAVERRIDRPLETCRMEMKTALRLRDLTVDAAYIDGTH